MLSSVLDTDIGQSEGEQLHIGISMTDAALECLDCILGRDLLGPDLVTYLEIQRQVFRACRQVFRRGPVDEIVNRGSSSEPVHAE